jgi:hypothetical protein
MRDLRAEERLQRPLAPFFMQTPVRVLMRATGLATHLLARNESLLCKSRLKLDQWQMVAITREAVIICHHCQAIEAKQIAHSDVAPPSRGNTGSS